MASWKYFERIDIQIAAAEDPVVSLMLRARRAAGLARFGQVESADKEIQIVRSANTEFNPIVAGWTLFSEALCCHFLAKHSEATDRLKRCYAIAVACELTELRALASAWLSTIEFIGSRPSEALAWLTQAFNFADTTHFETLARATLVTADCLSWSGQINLASDFYSRARNYAVKDNDLGMQSIILFNAATFSVSALVLEDAFGQCDQIFLKKTRLQVESVRNLDIGLGNYSLSSYIPIAEAELLCVERDWANALQQLTEHISKASIEGQKRLLPRFLAQRAWCLANLGLESDAMESIAEAIKSKHLCSDFDDLAVVNQRIHQALCLIQSHQTINMVFLESAERCLSEFRLQQRRLYELIKSQVDLGLTGFDQQK